MLADERPGERQWIPVDVGQSGAVERDGLGRVHRLVGTRVGHGGRVDLVLITTVSGVLLMPAARTTSRATYVPATSIENDGVTLFGSSSAAALPTGRDCSVQKYDRVAIWTFAGRRAGERHESAHRCRLIRSRVGNGRRATVTTVTMSAALFVVPSWTTRRTTYVPWPIDQKARRCRRGIQERRSASCRPRDEAPGEGQWIAVGIKRSRAVERGRLGHLSDEIRAGVRHGRRVANGDAHRIRAARERPVVHDELRVVHTLSIRREGRIDRAARRERGHAARRDGQRPGVGQRGAFRSMEPLPVSCTGVPIPGIV